MHCRAKHRRAWGVLRGRGGTLALVERGWGCSTGAVWGQQEEGERGMQEQQGAVHQDWWMQRSGPTRVAATFILL